MPVRIVKDNPDEMVVNDNFNFDNPQEQSGGGQGIDLSFLNDLLGGGGTKGGGSGLLGGLINSFFGDGGGSQQNNNKIGNSGGGILSALGGMAVNACINYAINSFTNKGKGGMFSKSSPPSKEDVDGLLNERLHSAEICVSLWSHTAFADQQMQAQEKQIIGQLIKDTVKQLFPASIAEQSEVEQLLLEKVANPIDYDDVVDEASQDQNFAAQLYQQACLLTAADKAFGRDEDDYIYNLASDLGIDDNNAQAIRQKFGIA
ncbi:MAG: DUF533 domain-containing protein [Cytophagales bacterium]|nr:MAG: DUF533 domain-containing protein [Cytophagales bacterium]